MDEQNKLKLIINRLKELQEPTKIIKVRRTNSHGEYYFCNLAVKKSLKTPQRKLIEDYFNELVNNINLYFGTNFSGRKKGFIVDIFLDKFKKDLDGFEISVSEGSIKKLISNLL